MTSKSQSTSKPANKPNEKTGAALVVFGTDEEGKSRAARFKPEDAERALKAAATMKLKSLRATSDELRLLADQLPLGRIYASGLGFVPEVQKAFVERLQELAEPKPAPGLPKSWDAIDVGHLVLARDLPDDGFYEAIVVAKDKDMLTIKFRNYPLAAPQTVHRSTLGLIKPSV